jgi:hypothetical protein
MTPNRKSTLTPFHEWLLFGLILALALFLRVWKLDSEPPGLYIDPAFVGWGALRILHEGWRPWGNMPILLTWPAVLYQCAAWFALVKPTQSTLTFFFTVLALSAFPFIYLFFRRLTDAPTALLTLFFLAVMYWHLNACRNALTGNQVYLYQFAALGLSLWGLETSRRWALAAAGLFFAAGFYGYQSYKFFPLLAVLLLAYEWYTRRELVRRSAAGVAFFLSAALAALLPLALDGMVHGFFSGRENWYFVGRVMEEKKSLQPLWDGMVKTALLFNFKGEPLPEGPACGGGMLDPVTGVLFLAGLLLALRRPLERASFYGLAGFTVLTLPSLLSIGPSAHRILGVLPFVAFLAARAFVNLGGRTPLPARRVLAMTALLGAGGLNAKMYFVDQAKSPDRALNHSLDATRVAEAVLSHPDTDFCLSPGLAQHFTVKYLTYFQKNRVGDLGVPPGLTPTFTPGHPALCFALEAGKGGWLNLLKALYPGGREEEALDLQGNKLASFYYVDSQEIGTARGNPLLKHGLLCHYACSDPPLSLSRWDPIINLTTVGDLPNASSTYFRVEWTGSLVCQTAGDYSFLLLTSEDGKVYLDGKAVIDSARGTGTRLKLGKGPHPLRLTLSRDDNGNGVRMDYHFLWQPPGQKGYKIVPAAAFGEIKPKMGVTP